MALHSLKDLFVHQLKDLYSAEQQLTRALPKMAKRASSGSLRNAFNEHAQVTERQKERLEKLFESLDKKPGGQKCKGMEGLIEEGSELLDEKGDDSVIDAGLIAAAQRVEHYEIAGYGTVRYYAEMLGNREAERVLGEILDEEYAADEKLNEIAKETVNPEAEQQREPAAGR